MLALWRPWGFPRTFETDFGSALSSEPVSTSCFCPSVDVHEGESEYRLDFDLPGVDPANVAVKVDKQVLTISGERKVEGDPAKARAWRVERSTGAFARSFELPDDAALDQISATSRNGVLTVLVPKAEPSSRKIQVQATS